MLIFLERKLNFSEQFGISSSIIFVVRGKLKSIRMSSKQTFLKAACLF